MNIDRREFLKRGGLLAAFSVLPGACKAGVSAAKEHVLKVYHKHVSVPVDAPLFEPKTGIPFLDLLLSVDRCPTQRLVCTCEYTLDGQCAKMCDEAHRLVHDLADKAADLWTVIAKHVDDDGLPEVHAAWKAYRQASAEYRRHYCTGWVQQENDHA